MWFDGQRQPDTVYVANISRGKDSTAMLRAIQILGFPLDMIVAVDIWATKDIPAELPPMVAFKDEYDKKCLERFGIPVTRLCAQKPRSQNVKVERERAEQHTLICSIPNAQQSNMEITSTDSRVQSADVGARNSKQNMLTYEDIFYRTITPQNARKRKQMLDSTPPRIYGFPQIKGIWCQASLKRSALTDSRLSIIRGATADSNELHCQTSPHNVRISNTVGDMVQFDAQSTNTRQSYFMISPRMTGAK